MRVSEVISWILIAWLTVTVIILAVSIVKLGNEVYRDEIHTALVCEQVNAITVCVER